MPNDNPSLYHLSLVDNHHFRGRNIEQLYDLLNFLLRKDHHFLHVNRAGYRDDQESRIGAMDDHYQKAPGNQMILVFLALLMFRPEY